ncbi:hypothetical protein Pyn_34314 [Prunus yedoensis var. nudiflora]|uniref:Uncharacterized protein n=1 Tax=Prunus yedoensis var. nudiflora TaxID=2094558 RepID=A0A314ZL77_PRUYE|nr:hypothetical protein Pyn_34314 [Prunus yedoensis var. nudiflora]
MFRRPSCPPHQLWPTSDVHTGRLCARTHFPSRPRSRALRPPPHLGSQQIQLGAAKCWLVTGVSCRPGGDRQSGSSSDCQAWGHKSVCVEGVPRPSRISNGIGRWVCTGGTRRDIAIP